MSLSLCPHCTRHVRVSSTSCPFCGAAIVLSERSVPRVTGLGRAALFAFGATLAACGSSNTAEPEDTTGGEDTTDPSTPSRPDDGGTAVPAYGTPADPQGPPPSSGDPGAPVALYGAPAP